MKLLILLPVLAVGAAPTTQSSIFEDWHPALPTDARSPCPGLNSLANHGFLPRDGRNLTIDIMVKALSNVNVAPDLATSLATKALTTSDDPSSGFFTLDNLKKHNIIEHDGSLSRKDEALGGDGDFDQGIFDEFLGYFNGSQQITLPAAAAARWGRIKTERGRNPEFTYSASNRFVSYSETAIYLNVLSQDVPETVSLDLLKVFFTQERFPYNEGWRPINNVTTASATELMVRLQQNTPEDVA